MTPYYNRDGIAIYCGDSDIILSSLDVRNIITDPPYSVDFDTDYTRFSGGVATNSVWKTIANDNPNFSVNKLLKYKNVCLFGANCFPLPKGTLLVWDKRAEAGSKNVMSDAEVAWLNRGHGVYIFSHKWDGFNRASERGEKFHPTQKPVALMRWVIGKANPSGVICDPYMGSGSTLIAAQQLGRQAIGIELSEEYCKIAVERLRQPSFFSLPQVETKETPKQAELFNE